jgi:hypothetical protein
MKTQLLVKTILVSCFLTLLSNYSFSQGQPKDQAKTVIDTTKSKVKDVPKETNGKTESDNKQKAGNEVAKATTSNKDTTKKKADTGSNKVNPSDTGKKVAVKTPKKDSIIIHSFHFGIGTNFNFLNSIPFSSKDLYGEMKYVDDTIMRMYSFKSLFHLFPVKKVTAYLGVTAGGYSGQTQVINNNSYYGNTFFLEPAVPLKKDSFNIVHQYIKAQQTQNYGQLSLSLDIQNIFVISPTLKLGVGAYYEYYKTTMYTTYSNQSVLEQDTSRLSTKNSFKPSNFADSTGISSNFEFEGVSFSCIIHNDDVTFRVRYVLGRVLEDNSTNPFFGETSSFPQQTLKWNGFYLLDASVIFEKIKASFQVNVRGFTAGYTPLWGVYATKEIDIPTFFSNILSAIK